MILLHYNLNIVVFGSVCCLCLLLGLLVERAFVADADRVTSLVVVVRRREPDVVHHLNWERSALHGHCVQVLLEVEDSGILGDPFFRKGRCRRGLRERLGQLEDSRPWDARARVPEALRIGSGVEMVYVVHESA